MDSLTDLQDWVAPLLSKLEPAARKKLARDIGQQLRTSQRARIASQRNPDGSPFEPRKPQNRARKGAVRRGAMFMKIRQAKHMKLNVSDAAVSVGFEGRDAWLARVHQLGLRSPLQRGGKPYQYPARELLGFSEADRELVINLLIQHLT